MSTHRRHYAEVCVCVNEHGHPKTTAQSVHWMVGVAGGQHCPGCTDCTVSDETVLCKVYKNHMKSRSATISVKHTLGVIMTWKSNKDYLDSV